MSKRITSNLAKLNGDFPAALYRMILRAGWESVDTGAPCSDALIARVPASPSSSGDLNH